MSVSSGVQRAAAAFQSRDFRRYQLARLLVILGAEAQAVAVAWQIYEITHRAIDLGYTGLALFLPGILFLILAGHTADRYDRRHIILICYSLQCLGTLSLLAMAWTHTRNVLPIYGVLFLIGSGRAFSGPASSALLPHLVEKRDFVNAVSWGATVFQMANVLGPAVGGVLYTLPLRRWLPMAIGQHLMGAAIVYVFTLSTLGIFLTLVFSMSVRPGRQEQRAMSVETLLAGFRYVWEKKLLLGVTTLDLFAVLLGGAVALMPIFAEDILHVGPRGLGVLRAAPAIGALIVSVFLTWQPMQRRAGVRMLICVGVFGAATVVFGLSRNLILSLAALLVVGAADMVSVVVRSSLIQLATPQQMRGRVSAVNYLFIGASNEFGDFESGVTAQWWGAVRAVVIGGIGSLVVTGLWSVMFPSLRQVDQLSEDALMPAREQEATSEPLR
ncbi:MAG TPA: MFS transporter [Acidobacteriaceae bacterium]|jgi:MFS family permease|nr:MFS transporter [Acidobacteriaceae bacterium]